MRVDERQIDGLDLERAEEQQETLLAERKEAKLPELAGDEIREVEPVRTDVLVGAMQAILAREQLNVTHLRLPQREAIALEALQAAANGRTTNLDQFVLASDRRSLLEQALAVLQPNLTHGTQQQVAAMTHELQRVSKHVTELRDVLMNLEDGQDDLMSEAVYRAGKGATGGDTTAKPKPATSDPEAARPPSQLSGPGPEVKHDRPPTTLTGAEVEQERPATTLTGPELRTAPKPATSLGDADEIATAARANPWWRKPTT